jgi:RNA polymerase sigma-70 factor (ECF subfamily)
LEPFVGELFRQLFPVIRAKCARILGDSREAEDVAQETFVRLCQTDLRDQGPRARLAWVYRTSTHLAVDRWRRRRATPEVPMEATDVPDAAGVASADGVVLARRALSTVLERVPADELEVAVLSRIDRLTHPEIAEVTGHSERTVRRMLDRVDRRLASLAAEVRS